MLRRLNSREFRDAWYSDGARDAGHRAEERRPWRPGANLGGPAVLLYRLEHRVTGAGPFIGRSGELADAIGPALRGPTPNFGPAAGMRQEERCACADWESWSRWFAGCDLRALHDLGFVVATYLCESRACTVPDSWGQVVYDPRWALRVEICDARRFAEGTIEVLPEPEPAPSPGPVWSKVDRWRWIAGTDVVESIGDPP